MWLIITKVFAGVLGSLLSYITYRFSYHLLFLNFDRTKPVPEKKVKIDNDCYHNISWWKGDFLVDGLHAMNPTRTQYFHNSFSGHLGDPLTKVHTILDIGCGGGLVCEALARRGYRMIGIDASAPTLEQAREHAISEGLSNRIDYRYGNATDLSSIPNASIDGVVMSDVLEHVHDLPKVISEISRVLKQDGIFVYDTLERTPLSLLFTIVTQELPFLSPIPSHLHHWSLYVKRSEMDTLFKRNSMNMIENRDFHPILTLKNVKLMMQLKFGALKFEIGEKDRIRIQYIGKAIKQ